MTDSKTNVSTEVRSSYEPVKVKVMKITPQGVLCQSDWVVAGPMVTQWNSGSDSCGSI